MDPPVLEAAARACAGLGERVREGNRDVGPETEAAMPGLGGWQTRRGLETLLTAWADDTAALTRYLGSLEDALQGCARDYRYTDHANAALFDIPDR